MSEVTMMESPFISEEARQNRRAITELMARHKFVAYPWEFWHYSSCDAYGAYLTRNRQTAKYGPIDWDPTSNSVVPIDDVAKPLNSMDLIQEKIEFMEKQPYSSAT